MPSPRGLALVLPSDTPFQVARLKRSSFLSYKCSPRCLCACGHGAPSQEEGEDGAVVGTNIIVATRTRF